MQDKKKKEDLIGRLKNLKKKDSSLNGEDSQGPALTPAEQKFKDIIDAATLISIFKNVSEDGQIVVVPTKAMEDLDRAIQNFSPKIWAQIQEERKTYLNFLGNVEEKKDTSTTQTSKFKWFGK